MWSNSEEEDELLLSQRPLYIRTGFDTLSPPISDAIDNIEYFSALYKWFNIDIIEK